MLPQELLIYINSFICKRRFNIEQNIIEALDVNPLKTNQCKIIEYKGKQLCKIHDNKELYHCFEVLSKITDKNLYSIHFETKESCLLARPFISEYGVFSHYCCSGKGIMFKKNLINNTLTEQLPIINITNYSQEMHLL
jgi:hypothetical protein